MVVELCPPDRKCGHRKSSLINLFIAFSLDLLELYCQECVYTILCMDKNYSNGHLFITSSGLSVLIMFHSLVSV